MEGGDERGAVAFDLIDLLTDEALRNLVEGAASSSAEEAAGSGRRRDLLAGFLSRFLSSPGIAGQLRQRAPPASIKIVDKLPSRVVNASDRWLQQTRLKIKGVHGDIIAEAAKGFGKFQQQAPQQQDGEGAIEPAMPLRAAIVAAEPIRANQPLLNAEQVCGNVVVCERGGCPFAKKAMFCQEAGAAAVVVIQSVNVWPYVMTDSTGAGADVNIPVVMVQQAHGQQLLKRLRAVPAAVAASIASSSSAADVTKSGGEKAEAPLEEADEEEQAEEQEQREQGEGEATAERVEAENTQSVEVELSTTKSEDPCSICFEGLEGEKCTQLPCLHVYHHECIAKWLGMRNTCPTCRHQLPTDDEEFNAQQQRERNDAAARKEMADTWYS